MDTHHHDKVFFVTFAAVVGFLGTFTLAIMLIANVLDEPAPDENALVQLEERIKPAGQVYTDAAALMKVSAPVAARAAMSGTEVVTKICTACHGTGVLNAPKIGDKAAWAKLKSAGISGLTASVIKGKNAMPPRGGDPSLSDAEIKSAIEQMLKGV